MKQGYQLRGEVPQAVSQMARKPDPHQRRVQARRLPWSRMNPEQRDIALAAMRRGMRAIKEIAGA